MSVNVAAPPLAVAGAEPVEVTLTEAISGAGVEVTLITGDTVVYSDAGSGDVTFDVRPAPRPGGRPVTFHGEGDQEDFYVYPSDVMAYVSSEVLDRELFNIPGLIRAGLDDASSESLPVIVVFEQERSAQQLERSAQQLEREAEVLPGSEATVGVASLPGAGVKVDRGKAGEKAAERGKARRFWQALANDEPDRDRGGAPALKEGVAKVLLDRSLEITLDQSVPQIGAPEAWAAGYRGGGVTVAVLDTGVDGDHPDLAGQVVAAENFTDEADASDNHGHGTHVASTIAGTGAASGSRYTGVAPEADLLNGKVCNVRGVCPTSSILAAMEWATESGADVVNMSLGGGASDGSDLLSQTLNDLSAATDTLFVVAAGNRGGSATFPQNVGTPGAADAALTVGAVDKDDQLAGFSSRGPRLGTTAVKPNITAPGVNITAASAGSEGYRAMSGTSMATPHVAGAAALLAQAKPELGATELKDTLASTALDGGYQPFEQGTGRVDIPRAVDADVYGPASVDFGDLKDVTEPVERELTYTNHGDAEVTLELASTLTNLFGEPAGALSLSADSVTVPAGGRASVTVTVDPTAVEGGERPGKALYNGVITATAEGVSLRTGVAFGKFGWHTVTVNVLDHNGETPCGGCASNVFLTNDTFDFDNPIDRRSDYRFPFADGTAIGQVPSGTYTLIATIFDAPLPSRAPEPYIHTRMTHLIELEVTIDGDTEITLDARDAVLLAQPKVPDREIQVRSHPHSLCRERPAGSTVSQFCLVSFDSSGNTQTTFIPKQDIYVTPTPAGELLRLRLWETWTLAEPQELKPVPHDSSEHLFSAMPRYAYHVPFLYDDGIPSSVTDREVGRPDFVQVPTRYHADQPGTLVGTITHPSPIHGGVFATPWIHYEPGGTTQYFLADDRFHWSRLDWLRYVPEPDSPQNRITMRSPDAFPAEDAGTRRPEERRFEAPVRHGVSELNTKAWEHISNDPRFFVTDGDRVPSAFARTEDNEFAPASTIVDNSRLQFWGSASGSNAFGTSWRMWNLDSSEELPQRSLFGLPTFAGLAEDKATYRLEETFAYPAWMAPYFRTKTEATTTWTFESQGAEVEVPDGYQCNALLRFRDGEVVVPPCEIQPLIQLRYELGLDFNNRAPAGRAHIFHIEALHHSVAVNRVRVTDLTVDASFDDGKTWQSAKVMPWPEPRPGGGEGMFRVQVKHPKLADTNGFVALRVRAEDGNGGTVEQTMQRAYILR